MARVSIETITPEVARAWLANTTNQRPRALSVIGSYADLMKAGRWALNGESIILSDAGEVLDGQHRLLAVIQSGVPLKTVVSRGIGSDLFSTINVGKARSGADVLALSHLYPDWHPSQAAGVITAMATCSVSRVRQWKAMPKPILLDAGRAYRGALDVLRLNLDGVVSTRGGRSLPAFIVAAMGAAVCHIGWHARMSEFAHGVLSGYVDEATGAGSAAVSARNVWKGTANWGSDTRVIGFGKTQRCLRAFINREPLTKVYAPQTAEWDVTIDSEWWALFHKQALQRAKAS